MFKLNKLLQLSIAVLVIGALVSIKVPSLHALDNNFSDGITVDSALDTGDDNVGDSICDDGDGNCTLRAAIEEANSNPDVSEVKFSLSGSADFVVEGQNGYTIKPLTGLPDITESLTIDGYTQPGASANTGAVGSPFNGKVLIQINGEDATGLNLGLHMIGATATVKGLSIVNTLGAIIIEQGSAGTRIEGNLIGLSPNGDALGNDQAGIIVMDSDNVVIGGSIPAARNVISYNDRLGYGSGSAIATQPSGPTSVVNNLKVQGNYLGTTLSGKVDPVESSKNAGGVVLQGVDKGTLIGGTQTQDTNVIDGNNQAGVAVIEYSLSGVGLGVSPEKVSVLGNKITNTGPRLLSGVGGPNFPGLGIDIGKLDDTSNPPDGPDAFSEFGATLNDSGDADTGPNNYINFPVLNSVTQREGQATVNFNLDAADSPIDKYRIELFANDTPNASGYGEGQVFLGALTVSNGVAQQSTIVLPSGYSLIGKSISATTTAIDASSQSGFGATSEFSKNVLATSAAEAVSLASTGQNMQGIVVLASVAVIAGVAVITRRYMLQ